MDRVYIANLPPDIRIKDIDDLFSAFGKLIFIDINHRANPVYACVQFDSPRNAFNAVRARHGCNYEGYTLQLRLGENEVRKTSDDIPPSLFNSSYDRRNANEIGNNYNSSRMGGNLSVNSGSQWFGSSRSDMVQLPTVNRPNMSQQNIDSSNNRFNMGQTSMTSYSSGGRPNIEQQYSNTNRSNIEQQFTNRLNMQEQYFNSNRSNMPMQNNVENMGLYSGRPNMQQQYTNSNRSNIPQLQNLNIQNPNNSWNSRNTGSNTTGWNNDNFGNNNFNAINNNSLSNDAFARPSGENYTSGLSGAGRKWFDRFIRKGYSPAMARAKALERRTLPYLRDKNKEIPNNSTNMALETIGNTIISLLSTNPADNVHSRPSSSAAPQAHGNAVSRRQYLKSLDVLREIRRKRVKSGKDRISEKYHTQIVKDYEKFNNVGSRSRNEISSKATSRNVISKNNTKTSTSASTSKTSTSGKVYKPIISTRSEEQLRELMSKLKAKLIKNARELGSETRRRKRFGGAYKKRTKLLMDHGFLEMEAKSYAWNHQDQIDELLSLKREYDIVVKKTGFIPPDKLFANETSSVVYRNDLIYLEEYGKHRIKQLSKTILFGLRECIKRVHAYEKKNNIPLTDNKFTKLLLKITSREGFFKNLSKPSSRKKKVGASTTTAKKSVEKPSEKKVEIKTKEDKKDDATEDSGENQNEDIQPDGEVQNNEDAENPDNEDADNGDDYDGENEVNEDEVNEVNEDEENEVNEDEENEVIEINEDEENPDNEDEYVSDGNEVEYEDAGNAEVEDEN